MAKANEKQTVGSDVQESKFIDKTNYQWYNKTGTNKVTFCMSLNDIMEGNGETYEFKEKIGSLKTVTNKKGETNTLIHLYLFILNDGRFIVARRWDELK